MSNKNMMELLSEVNLGRIKVYAGLVDLQHLITKHSDSWDPRRSRELALKSKEFAATCSKFVQSVDAYAMKDIMATDDPRRSVGQSPADLLPPEEGAMRAFDPLADENPLADAQVTASRPW